MPVKAVTLAVDEGMRLYDEVLARSNVWNKVCNRLEPNLTVRALTYCTYVIG